MHVKTLYIATFFQPIEIGLSTVQMYRIIVKRVASLFGLPGFSGRPEQLNIGRREKVADAGGEWRVARSERREASVRESACGETPQAGPLQSRPSTSDRWIQ